MMKNLIKLSVIVLAVVFMACSCDPDPIVPELITPNELVGNWNFESLEFGGMTYTTCDEDLNELYDLVTFNMQNVSTSAITLKTYCMDEGESPWEMTYSYTLEGIELNLDESIVFDILNAEDFDGNTLELELVSAAVSDLPIGGVYTLTKQ